MAKSKSRAVYVCNACGASFPQWGGQCPECGAWNTLTETVRAEPAKSGGRFRGYAGKGGSGVRKLEDVRAEEQARTPTGIGELDRALGGGLVAGSVVLIGGDPGIGKSTLLLQALVRLAGGQGTLYVSGEESLEQIALRARRLGLDAGALQVLAETGLEAILAEVQRDRPGIMVVDSVQTLYSEQLQSAPGSVAQVRESAAQLVRFAKQTGTALFLVGHVTKEGALAGPRVLEHMVDTVLYFEGERDGRYRVLRAVKNRFGAVNELGVFAMADTGLKEVANPSAIFLSGRGEPVAGSVVMSAWEGTRPLLVEVQALVDDSPLSNPRRVALGLEQNRMAMLLAVLHRHGGIAMYDQDVYVNVVGGLRVSETAADLAILLACVSSLRDRSLERGLVVFGEVGLGGEVRPVPNGRERLHEAAKHGFTRAVAPKANAPKRPIRGLDVCAVSRLEQAFAVFD